MSRAPGDNYIRFVLILLSPALNDAHHIRSITLPTSRLAHHTGVQRGSTGVCDDDGVRGV